MEKKRHILIVEDDISILMGLEANLKAEDYQVSTCMNGTEALSMIINTKYDLILLDIMLPGLNGFEICKKVKVEQPELPIIMLTARGAEMDKIAGLDYGADDYITKPFSLSELLARVRAVIRRAYPDTKILSQIKFGTVFIDFKKMIATVNDTPIKFSKKEFNIISYFVQHE